MCTLGRLRNTTRLALHVTAAADAGRRGGGVTALPRLKDPERGRNTGRSGCDVTPPLHHRTVYTTTAWPGSSRADRNAFNLQVYPPKQYSKGDVIIYFLGSYVPHAVTTIHFPEFIRDVHSLSFHGKQKTGVVQRLDVLSTESIHFASENGGVDLVV